MKNTAVKISDLLKTEDWTLVREVAKESEKAFAVKCLCDSRLAWFPKSVCPIVHDDFYEQKSTRPERLIPRWLLNKKANELGLFAWDI